MRVIQAMENYLIHSRTNSEGSYPTSMLNDEADYTCKRNMNEGFS